MHPVQQIVAMIVKVLRDSFGLQSGHVTTVHSYTNDSDIVDSHTKDLRAEPVAYPMIPTSTGATKAIEVIFPELKEFVSNINLGTNANVSLIDFVARIDKKISLLKDLNNALLMLRT